MLAAECLGRLLPPDVVSARIGTGTGLTGVGIASLIGAALPGGPMLAFPLAIALLRAGAGPEALVALITAWPCASHYRSSPAPWPACCSPPRRRAASERSDKPPFRVSAHEVGIRRINLDMIRQIIYHFGK